MTRRILVNRDAKRARQPRSAVISSCVGPMPPVGDDIIVGVPWSALMAATMSSSTSGTTRASWTSTPIFARYSAI